MRVFGRYFVLLCAWAPAALGVEVRLNQADGDELLLTGPVARIVTLAPHLAEGVYAAGAGDRLVATVEYSEYPADAAGVPRIGDAFRLDIERIVSLQPDLVIAWGSGNPPPAIAQMRALGLAVWTVEIRTPGAIPDFIDSVGRATGHRPEAAREARRLRQRLSELQRQHATADPVRYFYQVDARPLFTINSQHLISRGLALCGGRNIFADEPGLAFQVSREAVILANPDVLLAPDGPGAENPLQAWQEWPSLDAVQNQAMYLLNADEISRATPRFLDALEQTCKLFADLRR